MEWIDYGHVIPHSWRECRPSVRARPGTQATADELAPHQARIEIIWLMTAPDDRRRFHACICLGQRTAENRTVVERMGQRIAASLRPRT